MARTLRRKLRWWSLSGPVGGLVIALTALGLLHDAGSQSRQEATERAVATVQRQLAQVGDRIANGVLDREEARRLGESLVKAMSADGVVLRITEGGTPPLANGTPAVAGVTARVPGLDWTISADLSTGAADQRLFEAALILVILVSGLVAVARRMDAFAVDTVFAPIEGLARRMISMAPESSDSATPSDPEVRARTAGRGQAQEIASMTTAIDRLLRSAKAIEIRENRLSAILSSVEEAILVLLADGTVEQDNPAARRLFGRATIGQPFASLFDPAHRDRVAAMLATLPREGEPQGASCRDDLSISHSQTQRTEVSLSLSPMQVNGQIGFVAVLADITERLRQQHELLRYATHDRLTGLPNRAHTEDLITGAIARAGRSGRSFAVLSLDLSRFKLVTDTLGHRAGEQLLLEVARRLQATIGAAGAIGRIGLDDFAVILEPADGARAAAAADAILSAFKEPVRLLGMEHFVRPTVGVALHPEHAQDAGDLIRAADTALYAAKRRGGLQAIVYRAEMGDQARRHLALDQEMRRALGNGEFLLHFQPKVSLIDFSVEGFEALLRWNRNGAGLVPPNDFLPVAEDTGFIAALDEWVQEETCRLLRHWTDLGLTPLPVAVNVSPRHLRQRDARQVERALSRHAVVPSLFEIEVTEHAVMHDIDHAMRILGSLKEMGIRVAVDDFGTGHSSLNYLKRLPVSTLKIDRSFIAGVPQEREDAGIVATIIAMADILRLDVIAEGVERPEQAKFLRHHNCSLVQGWLTGYPIPAEEVAQLLETRRRKRA